VRQLVLTNTDFRGAELYTALATGVVEGSKNVFKTLLALNLEEHLKYVHN